MLTAVTFSPFARIAFVSFLVLLLLKFLLRRVPAIRDASPDYAFYTRRTMTAALVFVGGGVVLGTALAIMDVERWERVTLAYGIAGGVAVVMIRVSEQYRRKDASRRLPNV